MAASRTKLLGLLGASLFLGACAQSISTSSVIIDGRLLTDQLRNELVEAVYKKSDDLGWKCSLVNSQRQFHSCSLDSGNPSLRLSVGYSPKGTYRISVVSTYIHWFPQNEQDITSGKFIGNTQINLEEWMRALVPDTAIIRAERTYLDHDTTQRF